MNPAQIASTQSQILAELKRRESSNSLRAYIEAAWPLIEPKHPFVPGWHIDAISEHLEAVINGEIKNLLINIPPRHAKSTIVSVAFPSWVWTKKPDHNFLYTSHSHSLSKRDSVKTRNIIQSQWYKDTFKVSWHLADDQNEKSNFVNTVGGSRRATSVLSSIIGEGASTLVVDDPHSPRSVRSDTQRTSELDWLDQEFFTRVNDPKTTSKIIIMQRLDQRDASAHVLEQGDWDHLMLPAEYEPERKCIMSTGWEDPRTEVGEPLWQARFDREQNEKTKKNMGSKAWAGQGQQRPAPSDGITFKRQWLQQFYTQDPLELSTTMEFLALSVDLPFSEGANNSFAVFQVWGKKGAHKYLLDQLRAQCGFNDQIKLFTQAMAKWTRINAKWVEKKANGAALIEVLQKKFSGIIPITPLGSKEARADAVAPQFEAGDIWLPDPSIAPWISDYIEELVIFNNGLFNDQVDATTQAISNLSSQAATDWTPVSLTGSSKWYGR